MRAAAYKRSPRAGGPRADLLKGSMDRTVLELFSLSRRVAKVYNGKNYPRSEQISSMAALQDFFRKLDLDEQQASANTARELLLHLPKAPPVS